MATAGDLCTTIQSDVARSDPSISDVILLDIQSAIRDYEADRFFFNEQVISITVSATDTYALSLFAAAGSVADIIEIDNVAVQINSTRNYNLHQIDPVEMSQRRANNIQGYPTKWSLFARSLTLDPMPNAAYTLTIQAHVKATEIAAGGFSTSNFWTNEASELIRNAAEKRLWGRRWKNPEAAQAAAFLEEQAYQKLKRKTDALTDGIQGYL